MTKRPLQVAVVELNEIHDELLPTWLHLTRKNGYEVDFFISSALRSRDIFAVSESPRPKCYLTSAPKSWPGILRQTCSVILRLRALLLLRFKYDLIIANSVEPEENYRFFLSFLNKPMLAAVHNGNVIVKNQTFDKPIRNRLMSVVVLSRHLQRYLLERDIVSYAVYTFLGLDLKSIGSSVRNNRSFCVQGNMNFHRRNYDSLLSAASRLKDENVQCQFKLVGKFNNATRIMQQRIAELDIADYFTFENDVESYQDYYKAIYSCRFLLVLVDDSRLVYRKFFEDKCTSSLNVALGLDLIPVINGRLAETYGIEECSLLYESDDVYSGIKSALAYEGEQIDSLVRDLQRSRQKLADESAIEFENAISSAIDH